MYQSNVLAVVKAGREDLVVRSCRLAASPFASLELAVQEVMQQLSLIIPEGPARSAVFTLQVMTWKLPAVSHKEAMQEQRLKDAAKSAERNRKDSKELTLGQVATDRDGIIDVKEGPTNGKTAS